MADKNKRNQEQMGKYPEQQGSKAGGRQNEDMEDITNQTTDRKAQEQTGLPREDKDISQQGSKAPGRDE